MVTKTGLLRVLAMTAGLTMLFTLNAFAAMPPRAYLERVGPFGLRVLIDSDEPVNAYDVAITYDPSIVDIDSLDTSNSIVTVVPRPMRAEGGQIIIKGGSTTAFSGAGGELLSIKLKPISEGIAQFKVTKSVAYRADGTGAAIAVAGGELPIRVTSGSFQAYENSRASALSASDDTVPPEIVVATIAENPLNYGERLFVFQAADSDSGVSHYEARDRQWLTWSGWRQAENPYPLDKGAWEVQLKAVDNSGNFALATVYQLGNAIWKAGLILVLLAILIAGLLTLRRRKSAV